MYIFSFIDIICTEDIFVLPIIVCGTANTSTTELQTTGVPQTTQLLSALHASYQQLHHLWHIKKLQLEQCFQLRLFESDVKKVRLLFFHYKMILISYSS